MSTYMEKAARVGKVHAARRGKEDALHAMDDGSAEHGVGLYVAGVTLRGSALYNWLRSADEPPAYCLAYMQELDVE